MARIYLMLISMAVVTTGLALARLAAESREQYIDLILAVVGCMLLSSAGGALISAARPRKKDRECSKAGR